MESQMVSEALGAEELCRQRVTKVTRSTSAVTFKPVKGFEVDHHGGHVTRSTDPPTHPKSKGDVLLLFCCLM
jgi:hypothetical protein